MYRRNLININNINTASLSGHKINGLKANSSLFILSVRVGNFYESFEAGKAFFLNIEYFSTIHISGSYMSNAI